MTITTIQIPRAQVWDAFRQYRAAVRARHNSEDETLMRGYRALAHGQKVLDLAQVIAAAGADEQGRPKLAIVRADASRVFCQRAQNGTVEFSMERSRRANAAASTYVRLPPGTLPVLADRKAWELIRCEATVPLVPPQYRPAHALSGYHLLWEAAWRDVPHDPLLLKRLCRNLYVVLAQWDLTPLEQAVLRGRTDG